jgi:hypothetical protein
MKALKIALFLFFICNQLLAQTIGVKSTNNNGFIDIYTEPWQNGNP